MAIPIKAYAACIGTTMVHNTVSTAVESTAVPKMEIIDQR